MTKKEELNSIPASDDAQATPATAANTAVGARALVLAEKNTLQFISADQFTNAGCNVEFAETLDIAQSLIDLHAPQIIFMTLTLNGSSTFSILKSCLTLTPKPHVVVIASNDQINDAADAMRIGATDCLFHPFGCERLDQAIREALAITKGTEDTHTTSQPPVIKQVPPAPPKLNTPVSLQPPSNKGTRPPGPGHTATPPLMRPSGQPHKKQAAFTGQHPRIRACLRDLEEVALSSAPVFLQGEFGTGKELFARTIHQKSGRNPDRFIVVDCASLRPDTVASDIFGHTAGAFPAATQDKIGAALAADGGTLYLDEIGHLAPRTQSQLVRFLRSGMVQRLGAERAERVDVRIISATSHDPKLLLQNEDLLKDLYYQLNVASICLPPLRDRGEDISLLAKHFLEEYAQSEGRVFSRISPDALTLLRQHNWPGNVHELKNAIWNAVLRHDAIELTAVMLPRALQAEDSTKDMDHPTDPGPLPPAIGTAQITAQLIGRSLAEIEQIVIEDTIHAYGGSVPKAAKILGVSPSTIYRKRESWAAKKRID